MRTLKVGLIGSGFMGRSHALAFRAAPAVFDLALTPVLEMLADIDAEAAARNAHQLGFARSSGDWRALVADPEVELVDITTPNRLHEEMAMAAIALGKPVYCEKPLAPTAERAFALAEAAEHAGLPSFVGFNYLKNPLVRLALEIIESGEIGELRGFRGIHAEDYMADPGAPWTWRLDPAGGAGAIADLGSHIVSLARCLMGPVSAVSGDLSTVIGERRTVEGALRKVEVDDEARALLRFASGATGTIEASWIATGRKMYLAFELTGSKGSIALNMERMNEMRLFIKGDSPAREGYVEIPAGPAHEAYAPFCPAPGHQLGFNDIKTIEVKEIVEALGGGTVFAPDFREAACIQAVIDAIIESARERAWVEIPKERQMRVG